MGETLAPPSPGQSVVLDIGQDMGALVIYTPANMLGAEIEISPKGHDTRRVHVAVWERDLNGRRVYAAVFPPLPAGEYCIWGAEPAAPREVAILGGSVAEEHWE